MHVRNDVTSMLKSFSKTASLKRYWLGCTKEHYELSFSPIYQFAKDFGKAIDVHQIKVLQKKVSTFQSLWLHEHVTIVIWQHRICTLPLWPFRPPMLLYLPVVFQSDQTAKSTLDHPINNQDSLIMFTMASMLTCTHQKRRARHRKQITNLNWHHRRSFLPLAYGSRTAGW